MKHIIVLVGLIAMSVVIGCGSKEEQKQPQSEGKSVSHEVKSPAVAKKVVSKPVKVSDEREKPVVKEVHAMSPERQTEELLAQFKKFLKDKGLPQTEVEKQVDKLIETSNNQVSEDKRPGYIRSMLRSLGIVPCVLADGGTNEVRVKEAQIAVEKYIKKRNLFGSVLGEGLMVFHELSPNAQVEIAECLSKLEKEDAK